MLSLSPSRLTTVLLAGLLLQGVTGAANADEKPDAATADCLGPVAPVEDVGHACMTAYGLWHMFTPEGLDLGYTHGPDPVPGDESEDGSNDEVGRPPVCVDDEENGYYGIIIYARAHDDDDRFALKAADIRGYFQQANELLYDTARTRSATRDYVMHCTDGETTVLEAILPTDKDNAGPGSIFSEIRGLGYNNPRVKYWVWYDDPGACGCGGIGNVYSDHRGTVWNQNNGNAAAMIGITFGYNSWSIMMHENGHNNGAVQLSAPMSSGGFHCNDGADVMCYADGGLTSVYIPVVCFTRAWDCNNDDYFNPDPIQYSYLSNHWNLGAQYNRYIVGEDGVLPEPNPPPSVPCLQTLRALGLCS